MSLSIAETRPLSLEVLPEPSDPDVIIVRAAAERYFDCGQGDSGCGDCIGAARIAVAALRIDRHLDEPVSPELGLEIEGVSVPISQVPRLDKRVLAIAQAIKCSDNIWNEAIYREDYAMAAVSGLASQQRIIPPTGPTFCNQWGRPI